MTAKLRSDSHPSDCAKWALDRPGAPIRCRHGWNAGLEDEVDNHWGALFKAGVGSELGAGSDTGNNGGLIQALRLGASDGPNETGQKVVQRNLNVQPTLTIRPGFPVRVIVNGRLRRSNTKYQLVG
jgi:type IV secretory pathway VirB10-like protein